VFKLDGLRFFSSSDIRFFSSSLFSHPGHSLFVFKLDGLFSLFILFEKKINVKISRPSWFLLKKAGQN
jgi:hypothetical protein